MGRGKQRHCSKCPPSHTAKEYFTPNMIRVNCIPHTHDFFPCPKRQENVFIQQRKNAMVNPWYLYQMVTQKYRARITDKDHMCDCCHSKQIPETDQTTEIIPCSPSYELPFDISTIVFTFQFRFDFQKVLHNRSLKNFRKDLFSLMRAQPT